MFNSARLRCFFVALNEHLQTELAGSLLASLAWLYVASRAPAAHRCRFLWTFRVSGCTRQECAVEKKASQRHKSRLPSFRSLGYVSLRIPETKLYLLGQQMALLPLGFCWRGSELWLELSKQKYGDSGLDFESLSKRISKKIVLQTLVFI